MYATHGIDQYAMVKIEQQDRLARAHRRLAATAPRSPSIQLLDIGSASFRRRAAVALVTFLLGLGLLAGAAAAQDTGSTSAAGADSRCVLVTGNRTVC
jgi:hypothetical protein